MAIRVTCECGRRFLAFETPPLPTKCPACGRTVAPPGQKPENPAVEAVELLVESRAPQTAPTSTNDAPAKDGGAARPGSPKQAAAGKDRSVKKLVAWLLLIAAVVTGVPGGMYWHASYRVGVLEEDAAQLPKRREAKLKAAERGERDRHLMLIVTGPGTIQPGAPNQYQIQTRNLNDDPAAAELSIRVREATGKVVYEEKDIHSRGEHKLALPRELEVKPGDTLLLEVEASRDGQPASSRTEKLVLDQAAYVAHLATDKPMYRPGEVVAFRSLTLERFSLKPAEEELRLIYTVTNPQGETIFRLAGPDRLDDARHNLLGPDNLPIRGVGAGEFPIPPDAKGGEYTLTVREAGNRFPPQQRRVVVNQYQKPRLNKELEFTRKSYGPGDEVVAACRVARAEGGLPVADQPMTAAVQVDGKRFNAEGQEAADATLSLCTDANGGGLVRFKLPAHIERGQASLGVQFTDGGNVETLVRPIPIVLKRLEVDFYPEGGDLVVGVPNRVYFQARTPQGKPAELQGRIIDQAGQSVAEVKTLHDDKEPGVNQGMGVFTLTPQAGSEYLLRVDAPAGIEGQYPLPEAKADGVVLSIPRGVTADPEPIPVFVQSVDADRRLLVGAYCRGRLLDHRVVNAKAGELMELRLTPAGGVGGVYRITVFEDIAGGGGPAQLAPVAERLIYRAASARLNLSITPDKSRYGPGDRASLSLLASNEQGLPASALVMLAVVDKSVLTLADEKTGRSLPTHFLLTTEVDKPEDLEYADFLLGGHPKSALALDLLLGTQGWRRFAEQDPQQFRDRQPDDAGRLLATIGDAPVLTTNEDEVDEAAWPKIVSARRQADAEFDQEDRAVRQALSGARNRQERYEDAFEQIGKFTLRALLITLVVTPLVVAIVLLVVATKRTERAPRYVFMGGCLLVCFGLSVSFWVQQFQEAKNARSISADSWWAAVTPSGGDTLGSDWANGGGGGGHHVQEPLKGEDLRELPRRMQKDGMSKQEKRVSGALTMDSPSPKHALVLRTEPPRPAIDLQRRAGRAEAVEGKPANRPARLLPVNLQTREAASSERFEQALRYAEQRENPMERLMEISNKEMESDLPDWMRPSFAPRAGTPVRAFRYDSKKPASGERKRLAPPLLVREYAHRHITEKPNERSDFTETIYWHPVLVLPAGKGQVSFELPDSLTTFQATAFGHTLDGRLGAVSTGFASRLPFSVDPKIPIEVTAGDTIDLPVTIANDSDTWRTVNLQLEAEGMRFVHGPPEEKFQLAANQRTRRLFRLKPTLVEGEAALLISGETTPFNVDRIRRTVQVVPDGFPVQAAASGMLHKSAGHEIQLPETWVPGTLKLQVRVFPSILADLQSGLDSMLREPHGCFEQTSSSSYPNLLVLDYLRTSNQANPEITRRALELLDHGYKRLVTYECDNPESNRREGFSLFGGRVVPNEWLTAYGLMQFRDLSRVYNGVDAAMVERTRRFLLSRPDGKGGFRRGDTYAGSPPDHILNAYTLWALTENSGQDDLGRELAALTEQAQSSNDPYFVALVANSLLNRNDANAAVPLLKKLAAVQKKPDGMMEGAERSITYSSGHDLQVETTALAVLAWLKAGRVSEFRENAQAGIRWIGRQRTWSGGFRGTQATILALKALTAVTRESRTLEAGHLISYVGDKAIARRSYPAGMQEVLGLGVDDPDKCLKPGKNAVRIEITTDRELPYTLSWSYQVRRPPSADRCPVQLTARLDRTTAAEGETVHLTATVENKSGQAEGMAVAILGLPAGLTLPEDMKQLKDFTRPREGQPPSITAWETRGRELILYWRNLERDQKIDLHLDLICRVPGEYLGPASRAYLYYNAEQKCWIEPLRVAIKPKGDR